jgi:ureidoglycolate lyase
MRTLAISPLTRETFAPFGELITLDGAVHFPINEGSTERFHALSGVDVADGNGRPIISLFRGSPFHLPFDLRVMERHPLGSQSFIPLSAAPTDRYLIIVAPPSSASEAEISAGLTAFIACGMTGVTYAKGVWHHPLISLEKQADFLVVDRQGPGDNCQEIAITEKIQVHP